MPLNLRTLQTRAVLVKAELVAAAKVGAVPFTAHIDPENRSWIGKDPFLHYGRAADKCFVRSPLSEILPSARRYSGRRGKLSIIASPGLTGRPVDAAWPLDRKSADVAVSRGGAERLVPVRVAGDRVYYIHPSDLGNLLDAYDPRPALTGSTRTERDTKPLASAKTPKPRRKSR